MNEAINYTSIQQCIEEAGIGFSAAFTHGLLSAYCCPHDLGQRWATVLVTEMDPMNVLQVEALKRLNCYKNDIAAALGDADFAFQLVLNDEDAGLQENVLALRDWASGYWLGVDAIGLAKTLDDDYSREFIGDLPAITAIDVPLLASDDGEQQNDFVEIAEYCRMGAVSLYLSAWQKSD